MHKQTILLLLACCPAALPQHGPNAGIEPLAAGVSPCQDFYQYACGAWMAANPIPKQESAWGRFNEMRERNTATMRDILESKRAANAGRSLVAREIGDYYEACMNTDLIEQRGKGVLNEEMARIAHIGSKKALQAELVTLHKKGIGAFWVFTSQPDFENSTVMLADLSQGGMTLPGRTYYFRQDERSAIVRAKFRQHIAAMFILLGDSLELAQTEAGTVMRIETRIAQDALDRQDEIDPKKTSHKMTVHELAKLTPHVDWPAYFKAMGAPAFSSLNVRAPGFFQGIDALLGSASMDDIKTYLRWRLLTGSAAGMPADFVTQNFAFFGTVLRGAQEQKPRWWRCTTFADAQLGEALGQEFVARTFGAEGKEKALRLVREIEVSLERDIRELPWMTEATRAQALVKLGKLTRKIGYPERWIDYSRVKIARDDFLGNIERLSDFGQARELNKIGKPTDQAEWDMTPATVNADYIPPQNSINFPAGILQPPMFSLTADDAENLGAIGIVIGHELTHGFDNNGRRFDAAGNLQDWWKPEDDQAFQERAECLIQEYSSFDFAPGLKGNGQLTLGENIADNGGMRIAYMALQRLLDKTPGAREQRDANGLTPEQRFFVAFGRSWCQNIRDEAARNNALTNEHSIPRWRVNGTVQNSKEFQEAFSCKAGEPMVREPACRVW
jgi:putative endopeptidase